MANSQKFIVYLPGTNNQKITFFSNLAQVKRIWLGLNFVSGQGKNKFFWLLAPGL